MNIYEFLGYYIGDGHIIYDTKKAQYRIEFAGNADEQKEYFEELASFIERKTGKFPRIFIKQEKLGKSLRLNINNKNFVKNLVEHHKFTYKKNVLKQKYQKNIWHGDFQNT